MLTATALLATIGDARAFQSGRQLSAYLGLEPRRRGTGGKVGLGAISKRGDRARHRSRGPSCAATCGCGLAAGSNQCYLRMLLIHGARAVLLRARDKGARCEQLARRVAALANKAARIAWTALMGNEPYKEPRVEESREGQANNGFRARPVASTTTIGATGLAAACEQDY